MLIVSVIFMLILVIGVTYAAFHFVGRGSSENIITLGKLQLTLEEGNLRNGGSVPVAYSIYLDDVSLNEDDIELDTRFLKYSLEFNGVGGAVEYLDDRLVDGERKLTSGTLEGGDTNQYLLKIWITGDINGDIQNQIWKGKIRLEGTQTK